jgi:hypothetical protein
LQIAQESKPPSTLIVSYRDSLAEDAGRYSLVLANPPFAGALDYEATAKDLQRVPQA